MSRRTAADLAAGLFGVDLEGAACAGSGREFVDPEPSDVDQLVRVYCHHCPVVGSCREYGDTLAPHRHAAIYGARYFQADEPVDGWEVAS